MALNRSDKSRILRRYFPIRRESQRNLTNPRQFVIPAKAGNQGAACVQREHWRVCTEFPLSRE